MALKIRIVKEADPWDAFIDMKTEKEKPDFSATPGEGGPGIRAILKEYTDFLEAEGKKAGACLVCERRFRDKKEGE